MTNENTMPEPLAPHQDGVWQGDRFHYDYEHIARVTGWSVEDVLARGVSYCRRNPRRTP